MITISTKEARNQFSTVINQAAFGKERIVLTRRGKAIAAIVPIEDNLLKKKDVQTVLSSEPKGKKASTRESDKKTAKSK